MNGRATVTLRLADEVAADPARGFAPALRFEIVAGATVVGEITLRLGDTEALRRFAGQVGYRIAPEHRGRGYAADALRLLAPVAAEQGMNELWITCSPDNLASCRTAERAGAAFVEEADLPPGSDMYARGERRKRVYRWQIG